MSISVISENDGAQVIVKRGSYWGPKGREAGLFESSGTAISTQKCIESGIRVT